MINEVRQTKTKNKNKEKTKNENEKLFPPRLTHDQCQASISNIETIDQINYLHASAIYRISSSTPPSTFRLIVTGFCHHFVSVFNSTLVINNYRKMVQKCFHRHFVRYYFVSLYEELCLGTHVGPLPLRRRKGLVALNIEPISCELKSGMVWPTLQTCSNFTFLSMQLRSNFFFSSFFFCCAVCELRCFHARRFRSKMELQIDLSKLLRLRRDWIPLLLSANSFSTLAQSARFIY